MNGIVGRSDAAAASSGGASSGEGAALNLATEAAGAAWTVRSFGPFRLQNHGEALYCGGELVRIGSRARQILALLTARAGEVVSKSDLMAEVWPDTTVVETNLTVHIAALRQALGDGKDGVRYIVNVPGRGYRFVALVAEESNVGRASIPTLEVPSPTNLPIRLRAVVGLSSAIEEVAAKLRGSSLVTVAGPAGVGKTTLALHVAQAQRVGYPDGVWLVDLASLRDAEHVPAAVAATMRIELGSADPATALVLALRRSKALLLLDNCEHLIDSVADLAASIMQQCPDVVLLATSREPLRIGGEAIYGLAPLDVPPNSMTLSASEALSYPAVQLLVERATAAANNFALLDRDAVMTASICRQLDGLPLAIEFASALVGVFGIAALAARLDDRMKLIQTDMRGASDRHRTLTAALDWSYDLLDADEQVALQRLAVFAGGFTLEGAASVIDLRDLGEAGGVLARLHAKSLITSDIAAEDLRFRLLETTRAYALEKLELAGDADKIRLRHAAYFRDLLRSHRVRLAERDMVGDAIELDNIRTALRFAMGPSGETEIALSLASAAVPVWLGLALMSECRARLREVLALLTPEQANSSEGWDLEITRRITEIATLGTTPEAYAAWAEPAPMVPGEPHTRLPQISDVAVRFVWTSRIGDAVEMKRFAEIHAVLALEDRTPHNQVLTTWVDGVSAFYLGAFRQARDNLRRFLETETPEMRRVFIGRTGVDRNPHVRGMLGAALCLLGEVDEGLLEAGLGDKIGDANSNTWSLLEGKVWTSLAYEIARVEPADSQAGLDAFLEVARSQGLGCDLAFGLGLQGVLAAREGRFVEAEDILRQCVELLRRTGFEWCAPWFHAQLGEAVADQGRVDEGLMIIEAWMQRDRNPSGWYAAELRRSISRLCVLAGDKDRAERSLLEAFAIAETQGAVAWMQRASQDLQELAGRPS